MSITRENSKIMGKLFFYDFFKIPHQLEASGAKYLIYFYDFLHYLKNMKRFGKIECCRGILFRVQMKFI